MVFQVLTVVLPPVMEGNLPCAERHDAVRPVLIYDQSVEPFGQQTTPLTRSQHPYCVQAR